MRVLLVSHDFLPNHPAGTEIYTYQFGVEQRRRGHDVHVFTTEKEISRPHLSVGVREYGGLTVHELFNNLFYDRFEETWDSADITETFTRFLDDLKPDVVHFMHLMYLSVGCVEAAAERAPVFFTLHDYWLQCARFGQRVHADRSICHSIEFSRCGECMADFKYRQTPFERLTAKALARVRRVSGLDLGPATRRAIARVKRSGNALSPAPPGSLRMPEEGQPPAPAPADLSPAAGAMHRAIVARDEGLRERVLPAVTRFIAPSRFLRASFVEWGIPPDKIQHVRTGIDTDRFADVRRTRGERLRIGFIGTVVPHKGLHVLLEAWRQLPDALRSRAELAVWGPTDHTPEYVNAVRALAEQVGVPLRGRIASEEVPDALRQVDL
ncbi:MAG: glycosyltransferase, partial [Planctomycetota bacterium]